jgi:hypothetical protein
MHGCRQGRDALAGACLTCINGVGPAAHHTADASNAVRRETIMKPLFRIASALLDTPRARPASGVSPAHIALPPAARSGGLPLLDALAARRTTREFAPLELDDVILGALLWAADGINRDAEGGRTAPSALGVHEITVYALRASGAYRYDPRGHCLNLVVAADLRRLTGYQELVDHAPVDLVYVADLNCMHEIPEAQRELFAAASAGAMLENVYLYGASAQLAVAARGWMNRSALERHLQLPRNVKPVLAQSVGHLRA